MPAGLDVQLLAPRASVAPADPRPIVEAALDGPVGGPALSELCRELGGRAVAIALNDKTRPVPHEYLLPPLLERLEQAGVAREAITLVIAPGSHAPMRPDEFAAVVPAGILSRFRVFCHDAEDRASLAYLGSTRRGTPVWTSRAYAEAGLRIVVGDVEPHQFQGFSGGVKSAAIGLAGKDTIARNHSMMSDPRAQLGRYDDNPCRQDVEEIGRMIGVHFALNAVLNEDKQILHALAGAPVAVMQAGLPLVRDVFQVAVPALFDLMIVAPGGHPKDINLYQAQKALGHAARVSKPGATVILVAACPEGTGSLGYETWMADPSMTSHAAVLARFEREGYHIGPHKAFLISRDASRVALSFVSDLDPACARRLLLNPVADRAGSTAQAQLERALERVLGELPQGARIGVMPWANATIPALA